MLKNFLVFCLEKYHSVLIFHPPSIFLFSFLNITLGCECVCRGEGKGAFLDYRLCSLGIMFVCMTKPAKVAITEVITGRWNQLGLFPCEVSQVAESGPCVNFSVSQRYFLLHFRKTVLLEHQATKAWESEVQGDTISFWLFLLTCPWQCLPALWLQIVIF